MPTLTGADNFLHRKLDSTVTLPAATDRRIWTASANTGGFSIDSTKTRDGRPFLKVVQSGAANTFLGKGLPTGVRTHVESFYFYVNTAPGTASRMRTFIATVNGFIRMETDGKVSAGVGGGTLRTSAAGYADGAVHRIDAKFVTSTTTYALDVSIDGTALTQATVTSTAADITQHYVGSGVSTDNLTYWVQDLVWGTTSGDHPIGAHRCPSLYPSGDGTHNVTTSGDFLNGAGGNITNSTTTAWQEIDDWITGAGDTTTYVAHAAGASTEYTEHTLDDTSGSPTVWGAVGYAAAFAAGTLADNLTVRIVDSGGSTVADIWGSPEDVSETTLQYAWKLLATNPASTTVDGYKVRIGFSSDVSPVPRCSAVMVVVALAGDPGGSLVARPRPQALAMHL